MIEIDHVSKRFGNNTILKGITTSVAKGEVVAIVGPSGSGKSTLLRCINGLERPTEGRILLDGTSCQGQSVQQMALQHRMGMVFQHFCLFPNMTLLENIAYAPQVLRMQTAEQATQAARVLLERVNLTERADAYPAALSGGQKQRGAIARTLAMQPRIMLLDEPTSALDPEMVKEVLDVITAMATSGITMVIVTHEMAFARSVAHRILFLDEGLLAEDAPAPQFFGAPKSARARAFLDKVLTYHG